MKDDPIFWPKKDVTVEELKGLYPSSFDVEVVPPSIWWIRFKRLPTYTVLLSSDVQ
jgi:hypothetical protein